MLCEALLHVLVERQLIARQDALEAIDTVAELVAELAAPPKRKAGARRRGDQLAEAPAIIEAMRASFSVKG